jgi:hypothetical protein
MKLQADRRTPAASEATGWRVRGDTGSRGSPDDAGLAELPSVTLAIPLHVALPTKVSRRSDINLHIGLTLIRRRADKKGFIKRVNNYFNQKRGIF